MKKLQNPYQEDLLKLSSSLSRMLKRRFGKGPEACFVTLNSNRLTVYMRNFITPAEEVLIKNNNIDLAYNFRSEVVEGVIKEFAQESSNVLGQTFNSYFNDWDYDTNTGVILILNERTKQPSELSQDHPLHESLYEQIVYVSSEIHKIPKQIEVIPLNQNMYAVECRGMMLQIEKVLLERGYMDLLQERSREIKKSYIDQRKLFENVFGRKIEGLFMTWDYHNDCCYIFFYLR